MSRLIVFDFDIGTYVDKILGQQKGYDEKDSLASGKLNRFYLL